MRRTPLRILDLRDSPWVDGPGRTILQCASMADSERCRIAIGGFCGSSWDNHAYLQEAKTLGLQVIPIVEKRSLDLRVIRQILRVIADHSISLIHAHEIRSRLFGLLCAKIAGIPLVATCHGWIANSWRRRMLCRLDQRLLRFCDRVITVSETMAEQLERLGVARPRIRVIRNALIIDQYRPGREESLRADWGIPGDAFLIGNIGRLSPEKGQDLLLQALHRLAATQPRVQVVFVGIGPEEQRLKALAHNLGVGDRVTFAGYCKEMERVYRNLDLVVQSSLTEGMPNVILEAMLMEVPVTATDVGGTAEIVRPVSPSSLVAPGSVEALAAGIEAVIGSLESSRNTARAGRVFVAEHFNQDRRVEQLLAVYEEIETERCGISAVS